MLSPHPVTLACLLVTSLPLGPSFFRPFLPKDTTPMITSAATPVSLPFSLPETLSKDAGVYGTCLAAADFDNDGMPDLLAAYAGNSGGRLLLFRGNPRAVYPKGGAQAAPFFPDPKVFPLTAAPDFLVTGDFNGDGNQDAIFATRNAPRLFVASGDGKGNLAAPEAFNLPGALTAILASDLNCANGLTDLAVAISDAQEDALLVYQHPNGALKATPERFPLPGPAHDLTAGRLDTDGFYDLAAATPNALVLVHGRDRRLSVGQKARGIIKPARLTQLPLAAEALVVGRFGREDRFDLAVLTTGGNLVTVSPELLDAPDLSARIYQAG